MIACWYSIALSDPKHRLKQQMTGENADLKLDEDDAEGSVGGSISPVENGANDIDDARATAAAQKLDQLSLGDDGVDSARASVVPSSQPAESSQSENGNLDFAKHSELSSTVGPSPAPAAVADPKDASHDTAEQNSEAPGKDGPEVSKKAKRRAREAAKRAKEAENADSPNQVYLMIRLLILIIS